jgi:hypothetical protein
VTEPIAREAGVPDLGPSTVVPGETVRDLVARYEQEIADLLAELEAAETEADRIEQQVRVHPTLAMMESTEAQLLLAPRRPDRGRQSLASARPRTTVDARPRPQPNGAVSSAGQGRAPVSNDEREGSGADQAPASDVLSRMTRLSRSHWVWRTGVVLVLVGLILLKFG